MGALDCVSRNSSKMTATESTEVFAIDAYNYNGSRRDLESQSPSNSTGKSHSLWWNVFLDVPLLALVLILTLLYELAVIPSHKNGFICEDPKLSHLYVGDTVSGAVLIMATLILPILIILTTEMVKLESDDSFRSRAVKALKRTCLWYRSFGYGLLFHVIIVEVMKGVTGMPRPTFFAVCAPDTAVNCTAGAYITTFECTSTYNTWMQSDSYHSFPSGHTSISVYCGLFLAWYLQRRAFSWSSRSVLLVPVLQLICLTFAAVCSLTRITDHRHHWWDVTVGAIIGALAAVFSVLCLCKNFSSHSTRTSAKELPPNLYGTQNPRPVS